MAATTVLLLALMQPAPQPWGPEHAIAAAQADLQRLPREAWPAVRYLWAPAGDKGSWASVQLAINSSLSHSPFSVTALDMAEGRLIRLNLAEMGISDAQLKNLFATYDALADSDPVFHAHDFELVDKDQVWTDSKGRRWSGRWKRTTIVHPRIGQGYAQLVTACNSPAPLLLADHFCIKALSTLDGGLYYRFRGLRDASGKALMKFDEYLRSRGADRAAAGRLGSDERAALIRSDVTGKPRRIEVMQGAGVRPTVGGGEVSITSDVSERQFKAVNDPLLNLLEFQFAAHEVMVVMPNGFIEWTLWNKDGELQDFVPLDGDDAIAADTTVPKPHTPRLQPAVSCLRCHGPDDGWKPFQNDVQRLADGDVVVAGDLSRGADALSPDVINRLRGLYGGDLSRPIQAARNNFTDVVFRASGGLTVPQAADALAALWDRYEYQAVGPDKALQLLGVAVPPGVEPAMALRAVVPPVVGREDGLIKLLHNGVPIQRRQFERTWPDLFLRLQR